ncbi:MAG: sigma-70 family RNA polymerase sigma factor [Acidobacteriota bacterium]
MSNFSDDSGEISELLQLWNDGNDEAWLNLIPIIYEELKKQARILLRKEKSDHTLQTTALVHEVFLKLNDQRVINWQSRAHFFWLSGELMRRILVDYARSQKRQKRGGDAELVSLNSNLRIAVDSSQVDILELNDALSKLAEFDKQQAKIVELRYFCGCKIEEVAEILGISTATVKRDWAMAKAWLYHKLS